MDILIESFPFAFGVLLGLSCARLGGFRRQSTTWVLASVALGAFATLASGELRDGPLYVLFDVTLVGAVSAAVMLVAARLRRSR